MSVADVGWRKWSLVFDGTWARLGGSYQGKAFDLEVQYDQDIYDFHFGYEAYSSIKTQETMPGTRTWDRVSNLKVLLGDRCFKTRTTITELTHLTDRTTVSTIETRRWDPFFGARGSYSLSNRWAVNLSGDIGGFGIGESAEFTYQVDTDIAYRVSIPFSVYAGYRIIGYDLKDNSGGQSDITQYGFKVGGRLVFQ